MTFAMGIRDAPAHTVDRPCTNGVMAATATKAVPYLGHKSVDAVSPEDALQQIGGTECQAKTVSNERRKP